MGWAFWRRKQRERDLNDEVAFDLAADAEERVRIGLTREEAEIASRRDFGNVLRLKEEVREVWGWLWLERLCQDVGFSLRVLFKSPGFTIVAVLTLALGIGANGAIFTLLNTVLMKNLPVANPQALVRIGDNADCCVGQGNSDDGDFTLFPTATWQLLKDSTPEFEDLAAMQAGFEYKPIVVRRDGDQAGARSVMGEFVSGNYFRTFGLQPQAGRLLTGLDDIAGAPMTAVMNYETWQRDYAGDASIVGSTFRVNTKAVTIAGVAPRGFYGDRLASTPPDFYFPIETMTGLANVPYVHDPNSQWLYLVGRVKPGVSLPALQDKISALVRQYMAKNRPSYSGKEKALLPKVHVVLTPGGAGIQEMQETYGTNLQLLMAISGLVLLIACANIANLLLARQMGRKTEMSLRTALGAARSRIIRQLLTESVVLAGMGAFVGLIVAYAGTRILVALAFPGARSLPVPAGPSLAMLAFACGLALLTGMLFGAGPAWIAGKTSPAEVLRSGSRNTTGASLLQRGLVVFQAALSIVLLVGAGLFAQNLTRLQSTDMKLQTKNRYVVHINPQAAGYSPAQVERLYSEIEERFHAVSGIERLGISSNTPMEEYNDSHSVQIQGQPDPDAGASYVKVNSEYFDSVGTHIVMGRGVDPADTSSSRPIAVVNQAFVKKFLKPEENPLGRLFGRPGPSSGDYEIVGVVEDTVYTSVRWKDRPMYFVPIAQRPLSTKVPIDQDETMFARALVLETAQPISDMEHLTQQTLAAINPNMTVVKFQTLDQQISDQFTQERMIARLTALFGAVALLLATVGLYGVTAYTVARRSGEIGIRMALGAKRNSVIAMVMRGAMTEIALGLALGIPAALLSVRFLKNEVYGIQKVDGTILMISILALVSAASMAALIPALRAASIDPARVVRVE